MIKLDSNSFGDFDVHKVVAEIEGIGATSVHGFLSERSRRFLLDELKAYTFVRQAKSVGIYGVRQRFSSFDGFPSASLFLKVKDALEGFLEHHFRLCRPYPISEPLRFTEAVVQRYEPGAVGISPHRDGASLINLVVLLILEGKGRFCLCADREGQSPMPIRNEPGDMLLMRASGFCGADIRPFHFVDRIEKRRVSFGLRHRKQ